MMEVKRRHLMPALTPGMIDEIKTLKAENAKMKETLLAIRMNAKWEGDLRYVHAINKVLGGK